MLSLAVIAGLSLAIAIVVAFPHGCNSRTEARALDRECNEEAVEFRGDLTRLAGKGIVAFTSHLNQQRRQCLVEITSNRRDDSPMSVYDQIFEPNKGSFVASLRALHIDRAGVSECLLYRPHIYPHVYKDYLAKIVSPDS
jgi:hypothetical protein